MVGDDNRTVKIDRIDRIDRIGRRPQGGAPAMVGVPTVGVPTG